MKTYIVMETFLVFA